MIFLASNAASFITGMKTPELHNTAHHSYDLAGLPCQPKWVQFSCNTCQCACPLMLHWMHKGQYYAEQCAATTTSPHRLSMVTRSADMLAYAEAGSMSRG